MSERTQCTHPDRDEPDLICGYPLPCPHHTNEILSDGRVVLRGNSQNKETADRLLEISEVLYL